MAAADAGLRAELLGLLRERSYRAGKVILSSGKESDFYIDCKQTCLSAVGALRVGELLFETIQDRFPEARAVGGPTLGADPMVAAVAVVSAQAGRPLDAFIIRKEPKGHGTAAWIEGMRNLAAERPVVLVEDVITTGGSTLRSLERVREAGLRALGVVVLVDRLEGGREAIEQAGYPLVALFTREDFLGR
jgi:orotate phosphoribosyltransferase